LLHFLGTQLVLPWDHPLFNNSELDHRKDILDRSSMEPILICQVGTNSSSSISGMTSHAVGLKDGLPCPDRYRRLIEYDGVLINARGLGRFSYLCRDGFYPQLLLVFFNAGRAIAQHGIVNEVDHRYYDGTHK